MKRDCPVCDRPTDMVLCKFCAGTILEVLAQVLDLLAELEVTASRQARVGARSGGRSAETPLPYAQRASDAARQLSSVVCFWAGTLAQGVFTTPTAVKYLRAHISALRAHEMAEKAYDQITKARAHAMDMIDRAPDLVPAGQCGVELADGSTCLEILYGDPDRASVRCRCGAEHDMDRTWMLTAARDQEWTAAQIGRATPGITAAMVRSYKHRGQLTPVGASENGHPTYRVGDLLDLLAGQAKEAS